MTSAPRISIIIVTYNSTAQIDACLASLSRALPRIEHETIVVDNASPDGTAAAVRGRWPGVRVLDAGSNAGFARANNFGIRRSTGPFVLLLNPDTEVHPAAIERLLDALEARPDAAVAGPRLVDERGRAELSFGRMIGPWAEMRQKLLVRGHDMGIPVIRHYVERITRRPQTVDWVSGACLLVRRADADAVGLLDERFFLYNEDVDFCASIRARGRSILFAPDAEILHLRGRSAASRPHATDQAYRRSQIAFYEKHHPRWVPVLRAYLTLRGRIPD